MRSVGYVIIAVGMIAFGLWWFWPRGESAGFPPSKTREARQDDATEKRNNAPRRPDVGAGAGGVGQPVQPKELTNDVALLEEIRSVLKSDPTRAEQLAREYQRRFPDSSGIDENDALLVYAEYNQRNMSEARRDAVLYFRRHPDGAYTEKLTKLTGMHPPRVRRTADH